MRALFSLSRRETIGVREQPLINMNYSNLQSVFPLMKQLAIRLGCPTTAAKSLVIPPPLPRGGRGVKP
jgi:hypothetical protein